MIASVNAFNSFASMQSLLSAIRLLRALCVSAVNPPSRSFRQRRLLAGTEEAQELHFDDSGVVAGLDAEDALEDDLLDEDLLLRADRELFGDGAGDQVLEDAAVEGAGQGDRKRLPDDGCIAAQIAEHRDLRDERRHQAEAGAELGHRVEEVLAVLV